MNNRHKNPDNAAQFIHAVATRKGWMVNPDEEFVRDLAVGLARNYNRYGYYLCPCRDGDADRERDRDIICPCDYVAADHDEFGHCFCGLYLTAEFGAGGRVPESIPERRPDGI
jgi:ferredoxin-thioredoxin reductase catalytic subunit